MGAKELLRMFRATDPSPATLNVLRTHLERAGHPEFLPPSPAAQSAGK